MNAKIPGLVVGLSGFFGGLLATQFVDWRTYPKAMLAMGVGVVVSLIVLMCFNFRQNQKK